MKKFNEIQPKDNQECYVVSSLNAQGNPHFFDSYQDAIEYKNAKHPFWNLYRCIVHYENSLLVISKAK